MGKIKKINKLLLLILILASFLRLYRLGSYPPLNVDEAAIGYNAWSLIETGRDEHGNSWPLHFKSFGDYKPGGYFYIVLPLIKILGLNAWAVRLPSALMGVATVYLIYLLVRLIWQDEILGLVWAAVLALSPWHLHFSRGGWESNAALFFLTLGTYLFFLSLKTNKIVHHFLFVLHYLLAIYIYHSARIVAPALALGLMIFNWRLLWQRKRQLILPFLLGILFSIPLMISFLKGGASARFAGVGLLADQGPLWRVNELIGQHQRVLPARLIHNKPIIYTIAFFQKYFSHFSGRFLFIDGDEVPRSKVPEMGTMYLFEVGVLIFGFCFWLRSKKKDKYFPLLWLLVAPLASAMTFQAPSALRALPMVIPSTFFIALGLKRLFEINWLMIGVAIILYLWGLIYWWNQYFIHYLKRYPSAWPDFQPVANWLQENQEKYDKICIEGDFDQPYILTLFYLKYPPEKIQQEIKLTPPDRFGFSTVKHFGKYWFGDCDRLEGAKIISK